MKVVDLHRTKQWSVITGNFNPFKKEQTINALIYIVEQMGGSVDMHKAFKTLYFADRSHLSKYGRSITGDDYIAMSFGPVPSKTDDMMKAVRGDSYFSHTSQSEELRGYFSFVNKYVFTANKPCDKDCLSGSDMECLDEAISVTKDKSFGELTNLSHGFAWGNTRQDRKMSVKDILRESGDTEEYIDYIVEKQETEKAFCL